MQSNQIKWIPSFRLEKSNPNSSFKCHYTSLSVIHKDSRSRPNASYYAAREESYTAYTVLDIISVKATDHGTKECRAEPRVASIVIDQVVRNLVALSVQSVKEKEDKADAAPRRREELGKCTQLQNEASSASLTSASVDGVDGTRSSSIGSDADLDIVDESKCNEGPHCKECSVSYTVHNTATDLTPNACATVDRYEPNYTKNTSELYDFLFAGIDTDTDDDIFPPSTIDMSKRFQAEPIVNPREKINVVTPTTYNTITDYSFPWKSNHVPCRPLRELR